LSLVGGLRTDDGSLAMDNGPAMAVKQIGSAFLCQDAADRNMFIAAFRLLLSTVNYPYSSSSSFPTLAALAATNNREQLQRRLEKPNSGAFSTRSLKRP
jgi:hypothetical protein